MASAADRGLPLYVIYQHPHDYPDAYVLRVQEVVFDGTATIVPHPVALVASTLEMVRKGLPAWATQIQWPGDDPDPHIVEVWV